jgi:hypothetical protein
MFSLDYRMGGLTTEGCENQLARVGIQFAYRYLVQQKIIEHNLLNKYDMFVLTRSDELYLCDHVDFSTLDSTSAHIPEGEDYGGVSDRHIVAEGPTFMKAINLTQELVCNTGEWFTYLQDNAKDEVNMEAVHALMWQKMQLPVQRHGRSQFLVRAPHDSANWNGGQQHDVLSKYNILMKYGEEMMGAIRHCQVDLESALRAIEAYEWQDYYYNTTYGNASFSE